MLGKGHFPQSTEMFVPKIDKWRKWRQRGWNGRTFSRRRKNVLLSPLRRELSFPGMKDKWNKLLPVLFIAVFAVSRIPGLMPPNFSVAYAFAFCAGVYFRGASGLVAAARHDAGHGHRAEHFLLSRRAVRLFTCCSITRYLRCSSAWANGLAGGRRF